MGVGIDAIARQCHHCWTADYGLFFGLFQCRVVRDRFLKPAGYFYHPKSMKDRSIIVCIRDGKVLLVARARSRWSLPGGTIKRSETPLAAAPRELAEETGLVGTRLTYPFEFGGLNKRHQVFSSSTPEDISPEPGNEIVQCRWFSPIKIATLSASVPTRSIVHLFVQFEIGGQGRGNICESRV